MTATTLRLPYRRPFDHAQLIGFFAKRVIPGVERVDGDRYERVFLIDGDAGRVVVAPAARGSALEARIDGAAGAATRAVIEQRLRRMFDLDADIDAVNAHLGARRHLKRSVAAHPGQRVPGGWDGFEIAIRAVLGQQVTVAAARTLTERVVRRHGQAIVLPHSGESVQLFPTPAVLAEANLDGLGITGARIRSLHSVAAAVRDGRVGFDTTQRLDDFIAAWTALPGIGEWTAHYLAMRGMGHRDAFPAGDIVLRKAVARAGEGPVPTATLAALAERWRPHRAYAVLHLWRSTM